MEQNERSEKLEQLSREVLNLSRNTLLVNLRFLDAALSRLDYFPVPREDVTLMTQGTHILYNPEHVLRCYKSAREVPVRDYLHMVLHCVFRHMYMDPTLNRPYWDLACDIAVENIINELGLKAAQAQREKQQAVYIDAIRSELKSVTAERIYAYFRDSNPDPARIAQIRGAFYADDHEIWYMTDDAIQEKYGLSAPGEGDGDGDGERGGPSAEEQWKDVAHRMQVDMDTFGKRRGLQPGSLSRNLAEVTREKYDYTSFLKKFSVMGETMKINDDEFDYVYYTYGLQLYDRMPLVEPLEYKEVKRIRDFVIAIDSSGSTLVNDLAQRFVQKTYNVMKSSESFFSKINLHIIQCDAEIQEDVKITCQEDFDNYLKTMRIKGLGGTDFRPVFEHVEQLRRDGEFTNLKGLIYFTDGWGAFPAKKPDYETAFVFVQDEYNNLEVPSWAIKLLLEKEDI